MTIKTIFNWNSQSIATTTVQPFVAEYLRKEFVELNELASDNDDVKDDDDDDDDDDDANSKDVEVVEIGTGEGLTMLDRLVNLKYLSKEERNFLVAVKDELRVKNEDKSAEQIAEPYQ